MIQEEYPIHTFHVKFTRRLSNTFQFYNFFQYIFIDRHDIQYNRVHILLVIEKLNKKIS